MVSDMRYGPDLDPQEAQAGNYSRRRRAVGSTLVQGLLAMLAERCRARQTYLKLEPVLSPVPV